MLIEDPETIIHIRPLAWHIKFGKCKALKKELNEKSMPVMWHPKKWRDCVVSEDEKMYRSIQYHGIVYSYTLFRYYVVFFRQVSCKNCLI